MGQGTQQVAGAAGDQFYVTHCTTADSVLNNPGYAVRASSSREADVLDAAFHYPPYELPIDMWKDLPRVEDAPRRLARTEDPDEGVWVVHSAYLAKDTVDRDRSYFSHLLLLPFANPLDVLRSWGAEGWVKSYPQGADKKLPGGARLPVGTLVNDDTLTAFLGDNPPGPTVLSAAVCPARLRGPARERRDLFARMLQALLVYTAVENESRRRLYIHAEPGVIALLLYGAIRLLPPSVTENLTFSTFEPYHRNLRDYKLADVVGTYLGGPDRWLDPDLGTTRGVALDTFDLDGKFRRSSPELRSPLASSLPEGVSDLIELAIRGEWNLLSGVRQAVGGEPDGLRKAGKALARERGLIRVDDETAGIDELIKLQEDKVAADELMQPPRVDKVWKVVKKHLPRPEVRKAFTKLIAQPERVKELWEEGFEAILKEDFRKWDLHWTVLREAIGPEELRKLLNKVVGSEKNEGRLVRLSTEVRSRLRTVCAEVGLMSPRSLLVPVGLGEVESLLASTPECAGYSAFVLMGKDELGWLDHIPALERPQMRKRAREYLYTAPAAALAAYVHAARDYLDSNSYFLDVLFKSYSPSAAKLMDKLLSVSTLESGDWLKLCKSVKLTQEKWGEYLLEKDRLASLLFGLRSEEGGKEVWDAYLGSLTPALISPDLIEVQPGDDPQVIHNWERNVHNHLRIAAERLTKAGVKLAPALPEGGVAKLFAANNLIKWVDDPASAERDGSEEVKHACAIFEVDPLLLVSVAYRRGGFDQCDPEGDSESLEPIVALFRTCFPVDASFNTASRATREVIRLSHDCPVQTRGALQAVLLHSCVPDIHYQSLLHATWQEPLHPYAIALLNEWISRGVKRGAPKYAAPAGPLEAAPVVEAPFADDEENEESSVPEPVIQKRGRRKGKSRGKGSNLGTWLTIVVLAAGAIGLVIVAARKLGNANEAPPTQPDKPKIEKPPPLPKIDSKVNPNEPSKGGKNAMDKDKTDK